MKKIPAIFMAAALLLAVTACGTRGPLTLPPGPAPEPLLGNPKPAKAAPQNIPASDLSTAQKAPAQ